MRKINSFQKTILTWYKKNKRDLPWRNTTDPYKILLSEFMLQQTQVTRVIEKYKLFTKKYPTVKQFAAATPADIITLWDGLGYNRRALYLLRTIQKIHAEWNGIIPNNPRALQTCPGIGPYTAAAVCSFAFNSNSPVIDINILRITERYFHSKPKDKKTVEETTAKQLPKGNSAEWHNALMDFGAQICTDKPKCKQCPLQHTCKAAHKDGKTYSKPPTQSPFKDSDRFYRGEILRQLRRSSATSQQLYAACKEKGIKSKKKFKDIIHTLKVDQLIEKNENTFQLPQ